MASLLSPFNFGQKYAYFHAKITIHELASIPLVSGRFQAKWRIKNVYGLQSLPAAAQTHHLMHSAAAAAAASSSSSSAHGHEGSETSMQSSSRDEERIKRKQSNRKLHDGSGGAETPQHDNNGNTDRQDSSETGTKAESEKAIRAQGDEEEVETDDGGREPTHRRARFLSGVKDAFRTRKVSTTSKKSVDSGRSFPRKSTDTKNEGSPSDSLQTPEDSLGRTQGRRMRKSSSVGHGLSPSSSGAGAGGDADAYDDADRRSLATSLSPSTKTGASSMKEKENENSSEQQSTLHMHAEPRGSTTTERVKEHTVRWERELEVGLRIAVDKPRSASNAGAMSPTSASFASSSASVYSASSEGTRHQTSNRDLRDRYDADREKDQQLADAFGVLAQAELKVTVNSNIQTDASGNNHETHSRLGHVTINLAEFAPHPHHHHHHHHQHHHHHHHHHSHHPHSNGSVNNSSGNNVGSSSSNGQNNHQQGKGTHSTLRRSETRRYLLNDSRTNATLKVTIEMTHVAGARDYAVPAIRRGLLVGNIAAHSLEGGHNSTGSKGGSSASSDNGSAIYNHEGDAHRSGSRTRVNGSVASLGHPMANWPPDSVARHSRIPSQNLKTELSHKDAARAVQEGGGGGRLAFSFSGGAHHDRAPEDVVASIFDPNSSAWDSNANLMLTPTVSRAEKVKPGASSGRKTAAAAAAGDKNPSRPGMSSRPSTSSSQHSESSKVSKEKGGKGGRGTGQADIFTNNTIGGEKPEHHDSVRPALSAQDASQAKNQIPTRFAAKLTSPDAAPGVDIDKAWRAAAAPARASSQKMTRDNSSSTSIKASSNTSSPRMTRNHSRSSSASTMKSILRSGTTPTQSSDSAPVSRGNLNEAGASPLTAMGGGSAKSSLGSNSGDHPGLSRRTSQQSRPTSVHWDPNIQHSDLPSTDSNYVDAEDFSPASQQQRQQVSPPRLRTSTSRESLAVPSVSRMMTDSPSSLSVKSSTAKTASEQGGQSSMSTSASSSLPSVPSDSELSLPALVDDHEVERRRTDSGHDGDTEVSPLLMPPKTPPDVARKLALLLPKSAVLSGQDAHHHQATKEVEAGKGDPTGVDGKEGRGRAIKGTVGLSKDEAERKGYRGVGWGTNAALGVDASFWNAADINCMSTEDDSSLFASMPNAVAGE